MDVVSMGEEGAPPEEAKAASPEFLAMGLDDWISNCLLLRIVCWTGTALDIMDDEAITRGDGVLLGV